MAAVSPLPRFLSSPSILRTAHHPFFRLKDRKPRITPREFREKVRSGQHATQTSGCVPGYVQANFVALPKEHAYDFLLYCLRNPIPCPLLAVTEPGEGWPGIVAAGADVRTDIPQYTIHRDGKPVELVDNISNLWTLDMVGFLLGCSFSWERKLAEEDLTPKNVSMGSNVSMYRTSIPAEPSGPFKGPIVVSMRPYKPADIENVHSITKAYPGAHGAPIHWGEPSQIGIENLSSPDFGDVTPIEEDEVPVFWGCGVTPQMALQSAKLPLAITHAPGHMFITDIRDEELDVSLSSFQEI